MSPSKQAGAKQIRQQSPTIDAVCRELERKVTREEAPLVVRLAEIFLGKAPPGFLQERPPEQLAQITLGLFRFLQRSRSGAVDVEVLNPELESDGWYSPVTVIRTDVSERPFIVDTIREFLRSQDLTIEHFVYPVLNVERKDGKVVAIRRATEGEHRESVIHCEIDRVHEPEERAALETEIRSRLQDVVRATDDFRPMLGALGRVVAELTERAQQLPAKRRDLEEIITFLSWLGDEAFLFLGYRGYDIITDPPTGDSIIVEPGSGLGILRNEADSSFADAVPISELEPGLRELVQGGPILIISKTNAESTVHRRARMDYIGVKKLDSTGKVVGEHRFIGLFTSHAYGEDAENTPILREKLQTILEDAGVQKGTHDYKEIITIFNSMPKEELFLTSAAEIGADVRTVLTSYHASEVKVTLREDPLQRGVAVMVILPAERFSGEVRKKIERALVEAFDGEVLNYHLALGGGDQARLHFFIGVAPEKLKVVPTTLLERTVRELIRTWSDRVLEELEHTHSSEDARHQAERYGEAFSPEYKAATDPADAVHDIGLLESMQAQGRTRAIAFANRRESCAAPGVENVTELKVYLRGARLILSDFMPILESAGLRVIAVSPFEVESASVARAIVYIFAVQDSKERQLDVASASSARLAEVVLSAWAGEVSNDSLNALVLTAGLHWREVDVLRCYATYAHQRGAVASRLSLPSALGKYPDIARVMFELFEVRFDPERSGSLQERQAEADKTRARLQEMLKSVTLLNDDRALRRLILLIDATVRTNYYRSGGRSPRRHSGGVPYTSFKLAARLLDSLGRTRLLYEVWVRSSRMEGVHLRGAKVSRGGIRWSDRPDDFRTEVLGLVNTQMVKNAVIVPGGSKGGFITLKAPPPGSTVAEEGKEQYRTLIRGLLDVTDNLDAAGTPIPPERVVCYDEPDPYLVVAADKGTAKFSDIANAVAAEYNFWLGDAFASGGSHGYDHKKVAITARGAWECVQRHFRENGKDIQQEPFTVVGIGDMGGDVFGNGMLLSRQIRLVAAFDHRHVFVDPSPDPERSFRERERLYKLPQSSWDDYDRALLSPGGTIVPRGAKEVQLGPEAKQALGLPADAAPMDGETLVRAVLTAPVELLWNGGIGTYVKASAESDADAGDPPNDAVRVDATELRCAVVGEGGNLGFTQLGRIEYALRGGRINTDALDNSGGVDLSDREVNLKILLNAAVRSGKMKPDERNALLRELTTAVASLVVQDNRSQSLAISLEQARAQEPESLDDFRDLMTTLEKAGLLDRAAEDLPTMEALVERKEEGGTLTRPELCVLLAYSKMSLMSAVLKSPALPDDPITENYLLGYFPPAAVSVSGKDALQNHRLRREIVASQITNDLVDLMGATFVNRLSRNTGRTPAEVVRAWLIAARLAGRRALMNRLSADRDVKAPPQDVYRWLLGLGRVLERTARWLLQNVSADAPSTEVIATHFEGLSLLRYRFHEIVRGEDRRTFEQLVKDIKEVGAEEDVARELITLRFLDQLLEILRVARDTGSDPVDTARAFYRISDALRVPWLRRAIFQSAEEGRWEQRAAQSLADDLTRAHHNVVVQIMKHRTDGMDVDRVADRLMMSRQREVGRFRELLDEIQQESKLSLAGVSVAVREISALSERLDGAVG